MPELRQNYPNKEWAIIATECAQRREDLAMRRSPKVVAPRVDACPFCPSNEGTPPEECMMSSSIPRTIPKPWR
jgi:galactose-1-phosphate uridylyltransferase